MSKREYRLSAPELRADASNPNKLVGYCAPFNSPTNIGGLFTEVIAPGAFTDTIAADNIVALFNHNEDYVLGRNQAGTLSLREDARGLYFEIDLPDTQVARDLLVSVQRRDISGCSFGFTAVEESWDYGTETRTILKAKLYDISPVTYPAYTSTSVSARSAEEVLQEFRSKRPAPDVEPSNTNIDLSYIRQTLDMLASY